MPFAKEADLGSLMTEDYSALVQWVEHFNNFWNSNLCDFQLIKMHIENSRQSVSLHYSVKIVEQKKKRKKRMRL